MCVPRVRRAEGGGGGTRACGNGQQQMAAAAPSCGCSSSAPMPRASLKHMAAQLPPQCGPGSGGVGRRSLSLPSSRATMSSCRAAAGQQAREPSGGGGLPARAQLHGQQQQQPLGQDLHRQRQHSAASTSLQAGASGRMAAATAAGGAARLASLSRILLVNQPGSMFRNLANRKWPSAFGPISLLVFLFGTVMALLAAVRGALVRRVKTCRCCKGFGVVRCRLCDGRGTVDWRAKFSYSEMCPLCAAKRFVVCPDCGGHYHRRLFSHAKASKGMEAFMPSPATGVAQRPNPAD